MRHCFLGSERLPTLAIFWTLWDGLEGPSQINASPRAAQVYNNNANSSIQEARESPVNPKHRAFSGFNSRLGDDDVNESEESTDGESSVYDSSNDSLNFSDAWGFVLSLNKLVFCW